MDSTFLNRSIKSVSRLFLLAVIGFSLASITGVAHADKESGHSKGGEHSGNIIWVDHFGLQSTDTALLTTAINTPASGVFPGMAGLLLTPTGPSSVQMALALPKEAKVTGVRVCYASPTSVINKITLAQVADPAVADTERTEAIAAPAPGCVDSKTVKIKSKNGPVILTLGVSGTDKLIVREVGVFTK